MGLDEKIFAYFARRWRDRWRAFGKPPDDAVRSPEMAALLPRLQIVANAVAGRDVEVKLHAGPLTIAGDRLLLPAVLGLLGSVGDNERLAVVSTAFAAAAVRAGAGRRGSLDDGVPWIAAAGAIEDALAQEMPGWAEQRAALGPAVLATRPLLAVLDDGSALLEAVVQHRLGRPVDSLVAELPHLAFAVRHACARGSDLLAIARAEALDLDDAVVEVPLWGRVEPSGVQPMVAALPTATDADPRVTTERESRPRVAKRRRALDPTAEQDNPLTHSFEKVHTAEEYSGGDKRSDGSDELGAHGEALDELDLDEVVLSNERTPSVYRADLSLLGSPDACDPGGDGLRYDEWDPAGSRYLPRHCRVSVEHPLAATAAGAALRSRVGHQHGRVLGQLRDELHRVETALRWASRQADGPEIDLDAVIDRQAAMRAGRDGGDRLYLRRRRCGHDVAMLVLVDASLSTDAWVDDRRVLDTARDAATLLLMALEPYIAELGVAGFCSYTHRDCRFIALKGFEEPLASGLGRLAGLRPAGYTRIGPALRHGFGALLQTRARRRQVVLITDGKPSDADHYEGRHGIGDVRQALREGQRLGIETFALAIDPRAAVHLPTMFGRRSYAGLADVGALARVATRLFTRVRLG